MSRKRGNRAGMAIFKLALKVFGLRGAYGLLYIVCLYYLLFDTRAVASNMPYVARRFKGRGIFFRWAAVYKIFINQGKNLIDRYYLISGLGEFGIELCGYDKLSSLLEKGSKGIILLTAHVGNWQVAMTALEKLGKTVYLVMRPEENAAVKRALNIDGAQGKIRIISSDGFLGGVVEIMSAINSGCIVSIMGDRSTGENVTDSVLLGEKAALPYGAFSIASAAGCPVVVLLSAKLSSKKYMVDVSHVIYPSDGTRSGKRQRAKGCVQEFADILENYASRYPFQWFVYSDIWRSSGHEPSV